MRVVTDALRIEYPGCHAMAVQRSRLVSEATARKFLALLADLDIETDPTTRERALHNIVSIAVQHNLSAYDAAYLELALREGIPLATLDQGLSVAILKAGGTRALHEYL